ncbi:MAG: 3-isopropylmalate dehydratase small subunit [Methylophilaceae bacterium]|nr:3-isopropylmalate dehydratase small subunit [Methylophilaceae bacterium]
MNKLNTLTGIVVPLDRANVDTDAIIPKQFLKSIKRSGFGRHLFDAWRYLDQGEPDMDTSQRCLNPDFVLNQPRYQGASILLARDNFGCGSSREHAPWALADYGFRVLIAPSYADIFFNNCFKNGILPITLAADIVDWLFREVLSHEGYTLTINLQQQQISTVQGQSWDFAVEEFRKHRLLHGLDDIDLSLQHSAKIKAFEAMHKLAQPWLFSE